MRATILVERKRVNLFSSNIVDIGWTGFEFARDARDLVDGGWRIYYFVPADEKRDGSVEVSDSKGLIRLVREALAPTASIVLSKPDDAIIIEGPVTIEGPITLRRLG